MAVSDDSSFRDQISTTNEEGQRNWVYARKPSGKLHRYRSIVAVILLTLFFVIPWIRVDGQPFILLNIFERRFILFGKVFWPQDFHIFVVAFITLIISIVLFTVVYGRVWCGWACPQTLFLEMVYRKIEFLIEGDAQKQRKLDSGSLSFEKIWKKILKHIIFIGIAILAIHTLVSYFIGTNRVLELMSEGPSQNFTAFLALSGLTGAFYFVFARFREQVCTLVCPYGRLQGVMLDANSLVVAYDFKRGETRGRIRKNQSRESEGLGDCIDCGNCVSVCPTGIDIRNGTQLECVNCTACIDSCNNVMQKVGFNPGLIRIASYNEISEGGKMRFTGRILAYTVLLGVLLTTLVVLFITRNETETTILRVPGSLYQDMGNSYTNIYNVQIINKSNDPLEIEIQTENIEGRVQQIGHAIEVNPQETAEGVFLLYLDKKLVTGSKIPITFGMYVNGELIEKEKATFVGP